MKILIQISIAFLIPLFLAQAAVPDHFFNAPWILHYRYTETYKQRARLMTLLFFTDGTCSSTGSTICTWSEIAGKFQVDFQNVKNGITQKGNSYLSSIALADRITGKFNKSDDTLAGEWLLVEDHHPVFFELKNFNSVWDRWTLNYKFDSDPSGKWNQTNVSMNFDSSCETEMGKYDCRWWQFAEAANFWLPVSNARINFQTITGPTDKNPSGLMVSESNQILGNWYFSPL